MAIKRTGQEPGIPIPDLLELAEERLQRGQIDEALYMLRIAESESGAYESTDSEKEVSIPPQIAAARAALPPLLARALFAHSFTLSDPKARLAEVEEAARLVPGEECYLVARGACHLLVGEIEAARADFQAAHERWTEDRLPARAFALASSAERWGFWSGADSFIEDFSASLLAGLLHLVSGEAVPARALLSNLPQIDHNPSRAEAVSLSTQLFYRGALNFAARDFSAAMLDFKEASRVSQAHAVNLPWRGRLAGYFKLIAERVFERDISSAIECWQQALLVAPGDGVAADNFAVANRMLARQAWQSGDIERAVTHWRELAGLWRRQLEAGKGEAGLRDRLLKLEHHIVNLMLETGRDSREIVAELETAQQLDTDDHDLRLKTAERLMEFGKTRQALKHIETVESEQGISVDLLLRKAEAFNLLDRHRDALKMFERALELEPSNPVLRHSFVIFLGEEADRADKYDDYELAIGLCRRQLSIDPNYGPAITNLAAFYLEEGLDGEARQLIDRYIATDPPDTQKYLAAGRVYLGADKKKEAESHFKRAIQLDPSETCFFNIGASYWEEGYRKEAFKHFDRAAEMADIELLLEIATNLIEDGEFKEADRFLKKAIKKEPLHPRPHLVRGLSLMGGPFMMLPSPNGIREAARELAEAERLMIENGGYREVLPEVQSLKEQLEQLPPPPSESTAGSIERFFSFLIKGILREKSYSDDPLRERRRRKRR